MNKIRLLTLSVLACAAGVYVYTQQTGIDALVQKCNLSGDRQVVMNHCMTAYAADHLTGAERGLVAFRIGFVHDLDGNWEPAIRYYTEAINLFPAKAASFYNRGLLRRRHLDDFDGAIADFTAYLASGENDINALTQRARTYREKGDLTSAEADLAQASAIDPDYPFRPATAGRTAARPRR